MQREWKTWSQIAVMIMEKVNRQPRGVDFFWLEFSNMDDETSMASFSIDADTLSDKEAERLAQNIIDIFTELRYTYKISSATIH